MQNILLKLLNSKNFLRVSKHKTFNTGQESGKATGSGTSYNSRGNYFLINIPAKENTR